MVNGQNFMDELNKFADNIQGDPRQQVQLGGLCKCGNLQLALMSYTIMVF